MFLKRNFELLIKEVKNIFIYINPARKLHNNYCNYLFFNEQVFSQEVQKTLSLYSIFLHFCFCKRSCDVNDKNNYCILCSKVANQSTDDKVLFKDILIDWRDFSERFLVFSRGYSLMSLSIFWNSSRWLAKIKKQWCEEFYHIKVPFKLFEKFLNIMVKIYLNKIIEILNKLNASHHEYIFMRQRTCWHT